jgi:6-phosphogluconolactonase
MSLKTIVYVSNADSREVLVYWMYPGSGDLSLVERVATSGVAMPMAVSPDRRYLYVGLRSEPYSVASFRIDPDSGRLRAIATTPLPDNFAYIATDRSGRFLLGASYAGNRIAINPIGPHGFVQAPPVQVMTTKPNAHAILVDPTNRFVFVPCLGGDAVLQLAFDAATGLVRSNDPPAVATRQGAGPRHFRFHPNNAFAYLMNELDGTLTTFAYDAGSGLLTELQTLDSKPPGLADKPAGADLHLTPDGRFLYGTIRGSSTIHAYAVEAKTGLLSPIGHWPAEEHPRGFQICPRGRFLLCSGLHSHHLTMFRIDASSGALSVAKRYAAGRGPNWVEFVELP